MHIAVAVAVAFIAVAVSAATPPTPLVLGTPERPLRLEGPLAADELILQGSRVEVLGSLRARRLTIRSNGPVSLAGELDVDELEEQGAALTVSGVWNVKRARVANDDHAITFAADTDISGTTQDAADIVVSPGVTLRLVGPAQLEAGAAGGRIIMGLGSAIAGPHTLQLSASAASTLARIDVAELLLTSSASARPRYTLTDTVTVGSLRAWGVALRIERAVRVSGDFDTGDSPLEALGAIDFAGSGPQVARVGVEPLGTVTHSGTGQLTVVSHWQQQAEVRFVAWDAGAGAVLTDFPVLVSVQRPHGVFSAAQATGADVVFTDEQGQRLDHELERFSATDQSLVAWVRIPRFEPGHPPRLTTHFGFPDAGPQADPTQVWRNGFAAVYHLGEMGSQALDSTANANHGTTTGTISSGPGRAGLARYFTGDRFVIAPSPSLALNDTVTVEMQALPQNLSGVGLGGNRLFDRSWVGNPGAWSLFVWEAGALSFDSISDAGARLGTTTRYIFSLDRWWMAALVVNQSRAQTWVDHQTSGGSVWAADAGEILWLQSPMCLSSCYAWDPWVGALDEVRVSSVIRSAEWIEASARVIEAPAPVLDAIPQTVVIATGSPCSPVAPCRSGQCVDGVCCSTPCGTCQRCDAPSLQGTCQPVLSAPDPDTCVACSASGQCAGGSVDAGSPDAGVDAGIDAGADAGVDGGPQPRSMEVRCGCADVPAAPGLLVAGLCFASLRRRARAARYARSPAHGSR